LISRIVLVAIVIVAALAAVKDGRVLRDAGLTGSCKVYANAADGTQWEMCEAGRLEGMPDLSGRGCHSAGVRGGAEYWQCPAPLVSGPLPSH
jgi:hypothetical protein